MALQIPGHRDIINFRHVLVHGYDKVEDEVVWGIIRAKVPELRQTLDMLLNRTPGE